MDWHSSTLIWYLTTLPPVASGSQHSSKMRKLFCTDFWKCFKRLLNKISSETTLRQKNTQVRIFYLKMERLNTQMEIYQDIANQV